jgi:tetratricopeptide (TPR) repeat protein
MANTGYQLGAAFALAAASFAALPAAAAEPATPAETPAPSAFELSEEARIRYDEGSYQRALALFNQAYTREADPNLLFNIARCHEKLGEVDRALAKYDEFLASPEADPAGREKAEASRTALRRSLRDQRKEPESSAEARSSATFGSDADASSKPASSGGPGVTPWLLLGAGVAALASGAVVYSLGVSDHNRVEDQAGYGDPRRVVPMTQREADDHVQSGKDKKLLGGLLLGGGGAMVASSVLLFLLVDGTEPPSRVGLELTPRSASLAFRGRF